MSKKDKLKFVNNNIPPIFEIRLGDDIELYLKKKLDILKKDGSANFEFKKLENIKVKDQSSFLDGCVVMVNLWSRFTKILNEKK